MTKQAEVLFSAYRTADYAEPAGFAIQLATILSEFPKEVVMYVTSPQTGLQRRSKWPPTISEVLAACEQHQTFLARVREERKVVPLLRGPTRLTTPGALANVFIPQDHPRYGRLVEWSKQASPIYYRVGKSSDGRDGIWVALNKWEEGLPVEQSTAQAAE